MAYSSTTTRLCLLPLLFFLLWLLGKECLRLRVFSFDSATSTTFSNDVACVFFTTSTNFCVRSNSSSLTILLKTCTPLSTKARVNLKSYMGLVAGGESVVNATVSTR
ncbi:hypothetical protein [Orgyia pseudotsugata single capsid nuclopolyhedrovirus]|nr:hypothetical protein [Orgyia pseudotsugata single capsid nuclopolyhedrovirus]